MPIFRGFEDIQPDRINYIKKTHFTKKNTFFRPL